MVWKKSFSIFVCIFLLFSCHQEDKSNKLIEQQLFIWEKLNGFIYTYKNKKFSLLEENLAFLDLHLEQYSAIINITKRKAIEQQFTFLIKNKKWNYLEDFLKKNEASDSYYFYKEFAGLLLDLNTLEKTSVKEENLFYLKEDIERLLNAYNSFFIFAQKSLNELGKGESFFEGLLREGNFLTRLLELKKNFIAIEQNFIEKYKENYFSLLDYTQLLDLNKEEQNTLLSLWLVYDKKEFGRLNNYFENKKSIEKKDLSLFSVQRLLKLPLEQNIQTLSSEYNKLLDSVVKNDINRAYPIYKRIQKQMLKEKRASILKKLLVNLDNLKGFKGSRILDFSLASGLLNSL